MQRVFRALFLIGLRGMNIGGGSGVEKSGEAQVARILLGSRKYSTEPGPRVVFDVGANKGDYVRMVRRLFTEEAVQVYAFEPAVRIYSRLVETANQLDGVRAFRIAFGKRDGQQYLYRNDRAEGLSSLYQRDLTHIGLALDTKEEVTVRSLDSFCRECSISKIDLLKLDVEGSELDVLLGAQEMVLRRQIQAIQFEFGGCNIDSRTYFRDFYALLSSSYDFYRVVRNGIFRIRGYNEWLEIFLTTNFVAILRSE